MRDIEQIDKKKNEIALFKYGLIAPVVSNNYTESSQMQYFRNVASKDYVVNGKKMKFSPETVKSWYKNYKKYGYQALIPKTRSDLYTSRKLSDEVILKINEYKEKLPHISGTLIYQKLDQEGYIDADKVCLGTVLKYIRDNKEQFESNSIDRRAFVMSNINECWQADTSVGPYINIDGNSTKTYLIAIIDDKSRLIVGAKFFLLDNALNFQEVLKGSVKRYGIPQKLFLDNGGTYKNEQLNIICATLGISIIHARPYSGASKGKIERFFHTMKATWMRGLDWNSIHSIKDLNELLCEFINEYNNKEHSSLTDESGNNTSPHQIFFKDVSTINKKDNAIIDIAFLHTAYPTIRSDAIAKVKGYEYEVDMKYIKTKITLKYDPFDRENAWIVDENNQLVEKVSLVDKEANAKIKRKNTMY